MCQTGKEKDGSDGREAEPGMHQRKFSTESPWVPFPEM